jgi:hypothetical protein
VTFSSNEILITSHYIFSCCYVPSAEVLGEGTPKVLGLEIVFRHARLGKCGRLHEP